MAQNPGTLRITAPDGFGRRLNLPIVKHYVDQWPNVRVEMSFSDRVDNLEEDGLDLAIRLGVSAPADGLISHILFTIMPYCAPHQYI